MKKNKITQEMLDIVQQGERNKILSKKQWTEEDFMGLIYTHAICKKNLDGSVNIDKPYFPIESLERYTFDVRTPKGIFEQAKKMLIELNEGGSHE